jgi:hypothetical protein
VIRVPCLGLGQAVFSHSLQQGIAWIEELKIHPAPIPVWFLQVVGKLGLVFIGIAKAGLAGNRRDDDRDVEVALRSCRSACLAADDVSREHT